MSTAEQQPEQDQALTPTGTEGATPTATQIHACLQGIDGGAGPEDPRYGDRFGRIQEEINRLSGVDFNLVIEESLAVLAEEAKDLRVAGFLTLGLNARDGVAGMALGFELTAALAEQFGDAIYPRRANARDAALRFPLSDRAVAFLDNADDAADATARERLASAMTRYQQAAADHYAIDDLGVVSLKRWLERQQARHPKPAAPVEPSAEEASSGSEESNGATAASSQPSAAPEQGAALPNAAPTDDREQHAAVRQVLSYLRDNERWPEHVALSRAHRWAALQTPPTADGRTRIEAPRASAIAAIESACAEGRWLEGLGAAEKAFMEAGGQFAFSIQRLAADCARGAGYEDSAARIESEVRLLRQRLPSLETLAYEDGQPFASQTDLDWLGRIDSAAAEPADDVDNDDADRLDEARQILASQGLKAAFEELERDAPQTVSREQALVRLRQARLALEAHRADTARSLLEGTREAMRRTGHDQWDNQLTAALLRLLIRATEGDSTQSRSNRGARLRELRTQLVPLDVTTVLDD
jgi:type VI secretion system protein VasJ